MKRLALIGFLMLGGLQLGTAIIGGAVFATYLRLGGTMPVVGVDSCGN